jgi:hypothetical protein
VLKYLTVAQFARRFRQKATLSKQLLNLSDVVEKLHKIVCLHGSGKANMVRTASPVFSFKKNSHKQKDANGKTQHRSVEKLLESLDCLLFSNTSGINKLVLLIDEWHQTAESHKQRTCQQTSIIAELKTQLQARIDEQRALLQQLASVTLLHQEEEQRAKLLYTDYHELKKTHVNQLREFRRRLQDKWADNQVLTSRVKLYERATKGMLPSNHPQQGGASSGVGSYQQQSQPLQQASWQGGNGEHKMMMALPEENEEMLLNAALGLEHQQQQQQQQQYPQQPQRLSRRAAEQQRKKQQKQTREAGKRLKRSLSSGMFAQPEQYSTRNWKLSLHGASQKRVTGVTSAPVTAGRYLKLSSNT